MGKAELYRYEAVMTAEHRRDDTGDWLRMRSRMSNCMRGYIRRRRSSKMTSRMEELEREMAQG